MELIVVIAVISILAGIMVPVIFKYWDTQNIELTKEKLSLLKIAMIGDPKLIQNGVRYSFGYVGEYGELPSSLEEVKNFGNLDLYNDNFKKDAWNNLFIYTYNLSNDGRRSSGKIVSLGPDGKLNTADDIEIIISENEVLPAKTSISKVEVFFNSPPQNNLTYYFKNTGFFKGGEVSCCVPISFAGFSGNTKNYYLTDIQCTYAESLPIGLANFLLEAYTDANCSNKYPNQSTEQSIVVIGDKMQNIYMNQKIYIQ